MSTPHRTNPNKRTRSSNSNTRAGNAVRKGPESKDTTTDLSSPSSPVPAPSRKAATLFLDPAFQAFVSLSASEQMPSQTTPAALIEELHELGRSVTQGDLSRPEKITLTHATILDVMFARLTALAFANAQGPHFDTLMRLAFRAQAQCARTLEILASLKNPAVIAHQLNVAHQQFVAGAGTPTPCGPPASSASSSQPPAVLADSETIVRSAGKKLSLHPHESLLAK